MRKVIAIGFSVLTLIVLGFIVLVTLSALLHHRWTLLLVLIVTIVLILFGWLGTMATLLYPAPPNQGEEK